MDRILLALACLASAASAQSVGEKTRAKSSLGISPSTADFAKQVAISDMFEISQTNQLKKNEPRSAEDEVFAQMVTDHTKTGTELKALVASGKAAAEVPTDLDGSRQNKLDKLKDLSSERP